MVLGIPINRVPVRTFSVTRASQRVSGRWSVIGAQVWRLSVRCDAAHPLGLPGLLERFGCHAVLDACNAASIDAEALADLAALPITFCAGRRSSWSISARRSPCISASGAFTDSLWHNLHASQALGFVACKFAVQVFLHEGLGNTLQSALLQDAEPGV